MAKPKSKTPRQRPAGSAARPDAVDWGEVVATARRVAGADDIAAHLLALGRALSLPAAHMYLMGVHILRHKKELRRGEYGEWLKTLPFSDRAARKYKGFAQRMNGWLARNGTVVPFSVIRALIDGEDVENPSSRGVDDHDSDEVKLLVAELVRGLTEWGYRRSEARCAVEAAVKAGYRDMTSVGKTALQFLRGQPIPPAPALKAEVTDGRAGAPEGLDMRESFEIGRCRLILGDAFGVMEEMAAGSVHAVVTDPPFSVREFEPEELRKLDSGESGVWRAGSPSDGYQRARQPLFCTMTDEDRAATSALFERIGRACARVLLPGAHAVVACHDSLLPLVLSSLPGADLEYVGLILRTFSGGRGGMPARGCDASHPNTCTMPRTDHEPWVVLRRPMPAGVTVRQCLATFGTGALARPAGAMLHSVISSRRLAGAEKKLGNHPCQKPQAFMRQIVRAVLPLAGGIVLDPFAGSGSTLAACEHLGVQGIGVERHREYFEHAAVSIKKLAMFEPEGP